MRISLVSFTSQIIIFSLNSDNSHTGVALPGCTLGKTLAVMSPPPGKTTQNCHCWGFSGYICEPVPSNTVNNCQAKLACFLCLLFIFAFTFPVTLCPYGPTFQNRATPQTCTCTTPTSTSVYTCA